MTKALIVIDMLEGYMKDTDNSKKIIKNISSLIKTFQQNDLKVILSMPKFGSKRKNPVMIRLWGEELKGNPDDSKIIKELSCFKYDKIIEKSEYDVFYKTKFETYCKTNNIDELYFSGVFSGACIFFSAAGAAIRKIQPYLITDASGGPRRSLVNKGWQQDTFKRFKLMIGPLISTNKLIEIINK